MNNVEQYAKELGLEIKYKDDSILMKILSIILFFNRRFMTSFYTTINQTLYVPRKLWEKSKQEQLLAIVTHEAKHAQQARKYHFTFYAFLYLFPQSLAIFSVLSVILAIFLPWYYALIPLLFLGFLAPISAFWRKKFEVEGYTAGLFAFYWLAVNINKEYQNSVVNHMFSMSNMIDEHFTGPDYYWMWRRGVRRELYKNIQQICDGVISDTDEFYNKVEIALGRIYENI